MICEVSSKSFISPTGKSLEKKLCQICGDKARCVNYGALTCQSCRAFFRRHGFQSKDILLCPLNGTCEVRILHQQRRACIACRLAKCLSVGMNPIFFRKEFHHSKKPCLSLIPFVPVKQILLLPLKLSTLDLLNNDRSNLSKSHWTLLSNVIHAYDNFISKSNIHSTIQNLPRLSTDHMSNISRMNNIIVQVLSSMMCWYKSIPDFQILTLPEQFSLLHRNLCGTTNYNFIYLIQQLTSDDMLLFSNYILSIFGPESVVRNQMLISQLDNDSVLVKLMLIILAFSSNLSIITNSDQISNDNLLLGTFRLLGSQNVYVELLWNYMLYRYGYYETIIRLNLLIKNILISYEHITNACIQLPSIFMTFDNCIHQKTILDRKSSNEYIPLWGNS